MRSLLLASVAGLLVAVTAASFAKPPPGPGPHHPPRPLPSGSAGARRGPPHPLPSGSTAPWRGLGDAAHGRGPNAAKLRAKLEALRASGPARRAAHIAVLQRRFGQAALGSAPLRQELATHARRMAFLKRARLVATTELEESKRDSAVARIDKLVTLEQERHERRLAELHLDHPAPGPSGSAAPTTAPAPSGSAP